jgi:flagellar operon protein
MERLDPLSQVAQGQTTTTSTQQQSSSFGTVFQQELERQSDAQTVAFSKHAQKRVEERGIDITPDLMDQLRGSVVRAQEKGATNILAMDTDRVFLINVPNAKVITAMTQEEMKENIFTNIDGAVFL